MALVKKAAIAVIANSRVVESEGGRERRQAAVVVAPITTRAEAPSHCIASVEPEVAVGPTIVKRKILGPIRHKFKFSVGYPGPSSLGISS